MWIIYMVETQQKHCLKTLVSTQFWVLGQSAFAWIKKIQRADSEIKAIKKEMGVKKETSEIFVCICISETPFLI